MNTYKLISIFWEGHELHFIVHSITGYARKSLYIWYQATVKPQFTEDPLNFVESGLSDWEYQKLKDDVLVLNYQRPEELSELINSKQAS